MNDAGYEGVMGKLSQQRWIDVLEMKIMDEHRAGCVHAAKSLQLCLTLCDPMDCSPPGSSVHGDFPGKNTGVSCHTLRQRIFLTQGLNTCLLCLLYWQACSLPLVPPGTHRAGYEVTVNIYLEMI